MSENTVFRESSETSIQIPEVLLHFEAYVDQFRKRYNAPALSVAVWHNHKLYQAASGILNMATGVEATTDSIFQIASITKVFTASLVMQLVEEGRVDLNCPVKQYLRDFQLADSELSNSITVAQLLDHTSGIPGDYFGDSSYTQPNALARYVDRCSLLGSVHPPGECYSYSNAAYVIAGRLIEVVLGINWYDAIEERIFKPLGMSHAVVHPSQVMRYRVAMGHEPDPEQTNSWRLTAQCYLPIGTAPCGAVMTMSASDLIRFAKVHLNQGRTDAGEQWLNPESIKLMQQCRVGLPPYSYMFGTGWGLGWQLTEIDGTTLIGHGGGGMGQKSLLQLFPQQQVAIAALHNCSNGNLLPDLLQELTAELVGITLPVTQPSVEKLSERELEKFTGTYESIGGTVCFAIDRNELVATFSDKVLGPTTHYQLKWIEGSNFITYLESGERAGNITFLDTDNQGAPEYLYMMGRLMPRKGVQ